MQQSTNWQIRQLRLLSQHVAEQTCLLANHEAARQQLREQHQQAWQQGALPAEATIRLLVEQAVEQQTQQNQLGKQWQVMRHRQQGEEQTLGEQIEQEKVRQN